MFTGIVQALVPILKIEMEKGLLRFCVEFPAHLLTGLQTGASVSINGVCQTVVAIEGDRVWFEAMEETLSRTTFDMMHPGDKVNLERSAKIGDEIGGHLLSGHIFETAPLIRIEGNVYTFAAKPALMKYLFTKGFIALDGISLTLGEIDRERGEFSVHLIPETLKRTTLGEKRVGDLINLEIDTLTQAAVETIERYYEERQHEKDNR